MRSVLITGGTGSLGRALAEVITAERICIYSRDEYKQAVMREELGDSLRYRWFLGDVRDQERLRRALEDVDAVIHAAALKRVEAGEFNPGEIVKTNVVGTMNLIEAAHDAGVQKVLAISSDKACRPMNAYGASKLMMERIIIAANNGRGLHGPRFAACRFGNFAGSRGSVIQMWRAVKGPVPITHPDCTRFWMTKSQAVGIVLKALATMEGGELTIPKLPAFRVVDLAEAMHRPYTVVGLRPGEQLHEWMNDEMCSKDAQWLSTTALRDELRHVVT